MSSIGVRLAALAAGALLCAIPELAHAARSSARVEALGSQTRPVADITSPTADPWVYLGPQRAQVSRLALSPLEPERMMATLVDTDETPVSRGLFVSFDAGGVWSREPSLTWERSDIAFDANGRQIVTRFSDLLHRPVGQSWWSTAWRPGLEPERIGAQLGWICLGDGA